MRTNTAPDVVYTPAAAPHWSLVQMRRSSHVLPSVMERYYTTEDTLDIMELDPKLIGTTPTLSLDLDTDRTNKEVLLVVP